MNLIFNIFLIITVSLIEAYVLANFDPIPNKWDLDLLNETDLIDYGSYQSEFERSSRTKRSVNTTIDALTVNLTQLQASTNTSAGVSIGDSITYSVTLDLPGIQTANATDLTAEFFAVSSTTGVGGYCICHPNVAFKGSNVAHDPATISLGQNSAGAVVRASVTLPKMNTGGNAVAGDPNLLTFKFDAVLCDLPESTQGSTFYVTAGAEYDDEAYVWVGQVPLVTQIRSGSYDSNVNFAPGAVAEMAKGSSSIVEINAYTTVPAAPLSLEVFQAQGYLDLFHIGEISAVAGSAFSCADSTLWKNVPQMSASGLSNVKNTVKYDYLVNSDGSRNVSSDANLLTFRVPLYVMNLDSVPTGVSRDVAYVLTMGSSKLWTGIHTIKINEFQPLPTAVDPTTITAKAMFDTTIGVIVGDSAVFQLTVSVPMGTINFNVQLTGVAGAQPILARPIKYGEVAYIPPWYSKGVRQPQTDPTILEFNFGPVTSLSATTVILEVSFMTFSNLSTSSPVSLKCKIGGKSCPDMPVKLIPNTVNVTTNTTAQIDVVPYEMNIDPNSLILGGQVCLDFNVTVPSGASTADLVYEVVPDSTVTTPSTRVCHAEVTKIGSNLPCIQANANYFVDTLTLNISDPGDTMNNYAMLDIGNACPSSGASADPDANKFIVTGCIELPVGQSASSSVSLSVNFGLRQEGSTIWVSSNVYPTNTSFLSTYWTGSITSGLPGGLTVPYVFALEDRTSIDAGGANQFMIFQSFQMDYLLKFHPQTFGTYDFTLKPSTKFRICRIALTFIGRNFPCTKMPGVMVLPTDNVVVTWPVQIPAVLPNDCGASVTTSFRSLTNWGRTPVVPDLIADENSIVITAWYQVCENAAAGGSPIPYTLDYKTSTPVAQVTGSTTINVISTTATLTSAPITNVTFESTIGPPDIIYRLLPKILRFNLTIPAKFQNDIILTATNKDFATNKHVDFCNIQLVHSGDNVPCASPKSTTVTYSAEDPPVIYNGEIVYKYMSMTAFKVCYIPYSSQHEDSLITIEVAFRVKDYLAVGSTVTIGIDVAAGASPGFTQDYVFTIAEPDETNITLSTIDPDAVQILTDATLVNGVPILVGDRGWVTFFVQVPPLTISKAQVSILVPGNIDRPIMHIRDIKFDVCTGKNVLCTSNQVALQQVYPTTLSQSGNLRAFMSMDSVTTDLGYLVNAGFSDKWGVHNDSDNQFAISVQIHMGDAANVTNNGSINYIYLSIKLGDVIVVGSQPVITLRTSTVYSDRLVNERANIIVDFNQTKTKSYFYQSNEVVNFNALIYHHDNQYPWLVGTKSRAEGWPLVHLRIFGPSWMKYLPAANSVSTNYTNVTIVNQTSVPLELEFEAGILFPDIISLNFSLTMDPGKERPIGSGELVVSVVIAPICQIATYKSFPADPTAWTGCGAYVTESVGSLAPECYDPIPVLNECQITASSKMNDDSKPFYSIDATKAWSPALRAGGGWVEYLKFNFGGTARINRLKIVSPSDVLGSSRRKVTNVRIESSNNCDYFSYILETTIPANNTISFPTAIEASMIKIIITVADSADADTKPIAINSVQFYGCLLNDGNVTCCPDETIDATSPMQYRHFSVDTDKKIIYFCDYKSYEEGVFCYWTQRDPLSSGANVWTELPRSIAYIVGYSKTTGLTYFRSNDNFLLSTLNGKFITMESGAPPADVAPALAVPGAPSSAPEILYTGTNYKANYEGIWDGKVLLAQWTPCCTP